MLESVSGSIAPGARGLLLGQSFLGRLKSWSIDNQNQALILNLTPSIDPLADRGPATPLQPESARPRAVKQKPQGDRRPPH